MELSNVSVRVESGEEVRARYMSATNERLSDGFEMDYPEWLSLWFGNVSIAGRPAVVVELLGRALREAYAACGAGNPEGPDDGPAGHGASKEEGCSGVSRRRSSPPGSVTRTRRSCCGRTAT